MFTPDGLDALAEAATRMLDGANIVVTDGNERAAAPVEQITRDGSSLILAATFGEGSGSFEWASRDVEVDGVVIDSETVDMGRKTADAIWRIEVAIDLEG